MSEFPDHAVDAELMSQTTMDGRRSAAEQNARIVTNQYNAGQVDYTSVAAAAGMWTRGRSRTNRASAFGSVREGTA